MTAPEDLIECQILGPFEASKRGQPLQVGRGKQQALLVLLLLRAGEVVSTDRLIDSLWGERPPTSAVNSVHIYVSQLRKALGDGLLETRGRGYLLALEPEQLDLNRFERLFGEGRDLLASGEIERAAKTLRDGLGLWRGPPLSDVASEPFAHAEIARLEELRMAALEERIEADLALGRHAELVSELEGLVREHPLRERLRTQLMVALYRSGRQSAALDAYQQARRVLSTELGLEPGRSLRELEAAILKQDPQLDPPLRRARPDRGPRPRRGGLIAIATILLLATAGALAAYALSGDEARKRPEVLPNSIVRIDPDTLEPAQVIEIGPRADLVVAADRYVWVTHGVLRYTEGEGLRDAGDRTLTRVDPSTGETRPVGGGLAPCGLAADPSGDVWVANCFAHGSSANVVRVDAKTLEFEATLSVPAGAGIFRGLAYGGGFLWVSEVNEADDYQLTRINPSTGEKRLIHLDSRAGWLTWSDGYGDLWMDDFADGSVSRMHAETGVVKTFTSLGIDPSAIAVAGDAVWVGDWSFPRLVRLPAAGTGTPRLVFLPTSVRPAGVTLVAAGAGSVWAAVPNDRAVWRIDPHNPQRRTRVPLTYFPWGVSAGDDGIWVALRAHDAP